MRLARIRHKKVQKVHSARSIVHKLEVVGSRDENFGGGWHTVFSCKASEAACPGRPPSHGLGPKYSLRCTHRRRGG